MLDRTLHTKKTRVKNNKIIRRKELGNTGGEVVEVHYLDKCDCLQNSRKDPVILPVQPL